MSDVCGVEKQTGRMGIVAPAGAGSRILEPFIFIRIVIVVRIIIVVIMISPLAFFVYFRIIINIAVSPRGKILVASFLYLRPGGALRPSVVVDGAWGLGVIITGGQVG